VPTRHSGGQAGTGRPITCGRSVPPAALGRGQRAVGYRPVQGSQSARPLSPSQPTSPPRPARTWPTDSSSMRCSRQRSRPPRRPGSTSLATGLPRHGSPARRAFTASLRVPSPGSGTLLHTTKTNCQSKVALEHLAVLSVVARWVDQTEVVTGPDRSGSPWRERDLIRLTGRHRPVRGRVSGHSPIRQGWRWRRGQGRRAVAEHADCFRYQLRVRV
jgi:hypothetical protein